MNKGLLKIRELGRQDFVDTWSSMINIVLSKGKEDSDEVWFLEHQPVFTLGISDSNNNFLKNTDIPVMRTDRGGKVTYHGPGQLVGYPIFNLKHYKKSVSWYMSTLEDVIISVLSDIGINSNKSDGLTGVWVEDEKICAFGVRMARWTTMHGFALNLNPDMNFFNGIIPCGIFEHGVTSIKELIETDLSMYDLSEMVSKECEQYFINNEILV